jgi:hypothetical protein
MTARIVTAKVLQKRRTLKSQVKPPFGFVDETFPVEGPPLSILKRGRVRKRASGKPNEKGRAAASWFVRGVDASSVGKLPYVMALVVLMFHA